MKTYVDESFNSRAKKGFFHDHAGKDGRTALDGTVAVRRPVVLAENDTSPINSVLFPTESQLLRIYPGEGYEVANSFVFNDTTYRHSGYHTTTQEATEYMAAIREPPQLRPFLDYRPVHRDYELFPHVLALSAWLVDRYPAPIINICGGDIVDRDEVSERLAYIISGNTAAAIPQKPALLNQAIFHAFTEDPIIVFEWKGGSYGRYEQSLLKLVNGYRLTATHPYKDMGPAHFWAKSAIIINSQTDSGGKNREIVWHTTRLRVRDVQLNEGGKYPFAARRDRAPDQEQGILFWLLQKVLPLLDGATVTELMPGPDLIAQALGRLDVGFDYDKWAKVNMADRDEALGLRVPPAGGWVVVQALDYLLGQDADKPIWGRIDSEYGAWVGSVNDIVAAAKIMVPRAPLSLADKEILGSAQRLSKHLPAMEGWLSGQGYTIERLGRNNAGTKLAVTKAYRLTAT